MQAFMACVNVYMRRFVCMRGPLSASHMLITCKQKFRVAFVPGLLPAEEKEKQALAATGKGRKSGASSKGKGASTAKGVAFADGGGGGGGQRRTGGEEQKGGEHEEGREGCGEKGKGAFE